MSEEVTKRNEIKFPDGEVKVLVFRAKLEIIH